MEAVEREWAFNSERLKITLGIDGRGQEGSFMNATLQDTGNDPNLDFSIATYVEVPVYIVAEDQLADYLGSIFSPIVDNHLGLHVEIQLGPYGDSDG